MAPPSILPERASLAKAVCWKRCAWRRSWLPVVGCQLPADANCSITNRQPATDNRQPATGNRQPLATNHEHWVYWQARREAQHGLRWYRSQSEDRMARRMAILGFELED